MASMYMEEDRYTKDGTVDRRGNPADKTKTGNWKTSPFILGTVQIKHFSRSLLGHFLC